MGAAARWWTVGLWALMAGAARADHAWDFDPPPDPFTADALLDLSHLNEDVAGEHGFIDVDPHGDFVRGDGEPIRFWAVNTLVHRQGMAALEEHAKFLAKRGVNMVRWHGEIQPKDPAQPLDTVDERALDELFMLVAAMKPHGIYVTVSPYYAHSIHLQTDRGRALRRAWALPRNAEANHPGGLLFFDSKLQRAYKAWLRELFTRVNPHTGVALRDDPAVAIFQIQNEDSLLFWTFGDLGGADLDILRFRFGRWLAEKYGSLDAARRAWAGAQARGSDVPDDFGRGMVSFYNLWHLIQPDGATGGPTTPGEVARMADQAQFLTETMRRWNAEVERYLRDELNVKQVVNAGNWRTADPLRLMDLERYSYTANRVSALNRYTTAVHRGEYRGWAIVAGDTFTNRSVTRHPRDLNVALKQSPDRAMILPEAMWVPPNLYQAEGTLLTAAYQSLTGVDIAYWFIMNQPQWRPPSSANGHLDSLGKWVIATPQIMGNFPAAALLFRKAMLRRGEPVVVEHRALDDLWRRRPPIISEEGTYDPNRDAAEIAPASPIRTAVDPRAFLVGPVHVVYDSDPARTLAVDLTPYLHGDVTVSNTGELRWDAAAGVVTVDAPRAQGAVGFLGAQPAIALRDVTLDCRNDYAAILVVAMDDRPLADSARVLVQVGTTCRPTGWKQRESGGASGGLYEILSHGRAPWRVERNDVTLTLANPRLARATAVDPNGYAAGDVPLQRDDAGVTLRLPPDTMHVILER